MKGGNKLFGPFCPKNLILASMHFQVLTILLMLYQVWLKIENCQWVLNKNIILESMPAILATQEWDLRYKWCKLTRIFCFGSELFTYWGLFICGSTLVKGFFFPFIVCLCSQRTCFKDYWGFHGFGFWKCCL